LTGALAEIQTSSDPVTIPVSPQVNRTALWEQVGQDILSGFNNMYNLHILREPEDKPYPLKGWFFGWAADPCNSGFPGCDAIFAARSPRLEGPWEVYAGDRDGEAVWDKAMDPTTWKPVVCGSDRFFDSWHNGDPSVVKVEKTYYMAYSATGKNLDGIHFGQKGDSDGDIITVAGATSQDGLHWSRMEAPILVKAESIGAPPVALDQYAHRSGNYHRPSLMIEDGVFRVWFDGFDWGSPISTLYAENSGDFRTPKDWRILRDTDQPVIREWPNPDVVKVEDVYFSFADPGLYAERFGPGWPARQIAEAVSLDRLHWIVLGYIEPDKDVQANHVPEAFVWMESGKTWLTVNYGAQIKGDYRYDRIRMKKRKVGAPELNRYRSLLATPAP
jgi:hypothetical protein